ncbi:DUF6588 family protein [Polaribacter pacificus]|nr:DUF6588 family protein [Polaribacter pacificus]
MKKKITLLLFAFWTTVSFGQIDLGTILEGGTNDANAYLKGYLSPITTGFGHGINGGWYSTAKAHKFLGFDIKVIATGAIVPKEGESFTFRNADFTNIKIDDTNLSSVEIPTILGSQKLADRPLLEFSNGGNSISISSLPGSGLKEEIGQNIVPSAMVQLGVGLWKNTDVKIRFVPEQKQPEFEFSTFGIGVMHDIKQWIPFVKRLPFDVSVLAAWNDVKSKFYMDHKNNPSQALEMNTKTTMFQLVASKKFLFLTVFGGVGTSSYTSDVNVLGTFKTKNTGQTYTDPVALNYSGSGFRGNLGLNVKLLFLNISADYAIQEYNTFTATVGFTFR